MQGPTARFPSNCGIVAKIMGKGVYDITVEGSVHKLVSFPLKSVDGLFSGVSLFHSLEMLGNG
jgi:hypothetical protein